MFFYILLNFFHGSWGDFPPPLVGRTLKKMWLKYVFPRGPLLLMSMGKKRKYSELIFIYIFPFNFEKMPYISFFKM